ncbi:MAG: O-antigen ligase family protein [Fibrobacter sp.]|nr:O-antigen ligase family protein [Fibrobacter sp.]
MNLTRILLYSLILLLFASGSLFAQTDALRQIGVSVPELLGVAFIFVMLLAFIFARPVYGLILVICYYPFITGSAELGLSQIIAGMFIVLFSLLWLQKRIAWKKLGKVPENYLKVNTFFLLFALYIGFNSLTSLIRGIPAIDIIRDLAPWSGLSMFLFMETFVKKEKSIELLFKVQIAVMLMIAVYVFSWYFPVFRVIFRFVRLDISFLGILVILLTGIAGLVFKLMPKWLSILFCAVSGTFFILTPTRTAFITALFSIVLMITLTIKKRKGIIMVVLVAVFAYVMNSLANEYMSTALEKREAKFDEIISQKGDPSVKSRLDEISHAWRLFLSSPIAGIGVGHRYRLWRHWVSELKGPGIYYSNFIHSDFMNFLAKLGLIGTSIYLVFYYKIMRIAWKIWTKAPTERLKAQGLIGWLLLVAALIGGQSTPIIQTRLDCLFLGFVMGHIYCTYRLMNSKGKTTVRSVKNYPVNYAWYKQNELAG